MWTSVFISLEYIPRSNSVFNLSRTLFSKRAASFYSSLPKHCKLQLFHLLTRIVDFFDLSFSGGCAVVSHCGFNLHFSSVAVLSIFLCAFCHLYVSMSLKFLFKCFVCFFLGSVCFVTEFWEFCIESLSNSFLINISLSNSFANIFYFYQIVVLQTFIK